MTKGGSDRGTVPDDFPDVAEVREAVRGIARATPLVEAPELSERLGRPVYLKLENLQATGSFKIRGAAARLSVLDVAARARGVVACSSGNHGRAVAHVAERLGIPATVCVPDWVDPVKLDGIRSHGAEAALVGPTYDESEVYAQELARDTGRTFVSAFDDPWVIAGQGTLAPEILDALDEPPAAVLAPLSGGGLIAGIAGALRQRLGAGAPVSVGVSARRAAVMRASLDAGRPVQVPEEPTVANALAGGIGPDNRFSFRWVRDLVDQHATVEEAAIRAAMAYAFRQYRLVVEGGGATALAALLSGAWTPAALPPGPVVVVLSGGNVSLEVLQEVLTEAPTDARS
jgi:threonine dehydratase